MDKYPFVRMNKGIFAVICPMRIDFVRVKVYNIITDIEIILCISAKEDLYEK